MTPLCLSGPNSYWAMLCIELWTDGREASSKAVSRVCFVKC